MYLSWNTEFWKVTMIYGHQNKENRMSGMLWLYRVTHKPGVAEGHGKDESHFVVVKMESLMKY